MIKYVFEQKLGAARWNCRRLRVPVRGCRLEEIVWGVLQYQIIISHSWQYTLFSEYNCEVCKIGTETFRCKIFATCKLLVCSQVNAIRVLI